MIVEICTNQPETPLVSRLLTSRESRVSSHGLRWMLQRQTETAGHELQCGVQCSLTVRVSLSALSPILSWQQLQNLLAGFE